MCSDVHFFKPSVTVDVLALRYVNSALELLLIQRANPPFQNAWALPGGFIEADEDLESSACRELYEETGLKLDTVHFFGVYGQPGRDPRGRTITMAYSAVVSVENSAVSGQDDAREAAWFSLLELPPLAFDHARIVRDGLLDLQAMIDNRYPFFTTAQNSGLRDSSDWQQYLGNVLKGGNWTSTEEAGYTP